MADFQPDRRSINRFLNAEDGDIAKQLARIATRVERNAKRLCPVDTGRLRASITWLVDRDGQGLNATIGTNVDYAPFQEFGTATQSGQPFLRPALDRERRAS